MIAFGAGDKHVEKTLVQTSAAHSYSYQWLPNKTYVKMIVSHSYAHLQNGGYHTRDIQKVSVETAFYAGLNGLPKNQVLDK